jgi:TIR domain
MIKVFLSYHHSARKTAGHMKESLGALGMDVFLAHDDLEPSDEWREVILKKLRKCDVFVPLLTRNFHASLWTDQETGIAIARGKLIMPVSFRVLPYGFIEKFQALKDRKQLDETCWKIASKLASRPAFRKRIRDGVIKAFLESGTFEESARHAKMLAKFEPFSVAQLNLIVEGGSQNHQIYGGRTARAFVRKLIRENQKKIKGTSIREFEQRAKSWPW